MSEVKTFITIILDTKNIVSELKTRIVHMKW